MSSEVRIGFLGAGGIAGHHLKQLQEVPEAKIVGICDTVPERARARADEFGGQAYTELPRMLDEREPEALYICVPPFAHEGAELIAAARGIHLFVEKPVALSLSYALEVAAALKEAGVMHAAGDTLRYLAATECARRYLRGKTVAMVTCNRWGGMPAVPWWRVMEQSGGQLVEMTTHQVDLMRYLVGEVVEVHARYAHRALAGTPGVSVPDAQIATFLFESGAIGSVTTSCALLQGGGRNDMDFVLPGALVHYTTRDVRVVPEGAPQPQAVPEQPNIDQAFMRALVTGDRRQILCDYEDAVRTLDVTLAANESARLGQPVTTRFARR